MNVWSLNLLLSKNLQVDGKPFKVEVVDSVQNYVSLMKQIFDFEKIKALVTGKKTGKPIKMRIDSMNGGKFVNFSNIFILIN